MKDSFGKLVNIYKMFGLEIAVRLLLFTIFFIKVVYLSLF